MLKFFLPIECNVFFNSLTFPFFSCLQFLGALINSTSTPSFDSIISVFASNWDLWTLVLTNWTPVSCSPVSVDSIYFSHSISDFLALQIAIPHSLSKREWKLIDFHESALHNSSLIQDIVQITQFFLLLYLASNRAQLVSSSNLNLFT